MSDVAYIIMGIFAVLVVLVAVYLILTSAYEDYKYKSLSLPVEDDFILANKGKIKTEINPLEESKFNIPKSTGNTVIDSARQTSELMHKQRQEKQDHRAKMEIKRVKKELAAKHNKK